VAPVGPYVFFYLMFFFAHQRGTRRPIFVFSGLCYRALLLVYQVSFAEVIGLFLLWGLGLFCVDTRALLLGY